jgi:hypothetical protein
MSGSQIFSLSVMDKDKQVITDLQEKEGQYVKLSHRTLQNIPWWGDTKYFHSRTRKISI